MTKRIQVFDPSKQSWLARRIDRLIARTLARSGLWLSFVLDLCNSRTELKLENRRLQTELDEALAKVLALKKMGSALAYWVEQHGHPPYLREGSIGAEDARSLLDKWGDLLLK